MRSTSNRVGVVGFVGWLAIVGGTSTAFAQGGEPVPDMARPRVGLELGGGVWGGHMSCESENGSCSGLAAAGGANLEASWFFNPHFGITADAWVMAHTESSFTLAQYINTIGVKWRPISILTLHAGVGEAHATFRFSNLIVGDSDNAAARDGRSCARGDRRPTVGGLDRGARGNGILWGPEQ